MNGKHQKIFEEIKKDISNPPVLLMLGGKGHVTLVSDTDVFAWGAALCQEQGGMLRMVQYNSKKLPKAWVGYSIGEIELC